MSTTFAPAHPDVPSVPVLETSSGEAISLPEVEERTQWRRSRRVRFGALPSSDDLVSSAPAVRGAFFLTSYSLIRLPDWIFHLVTGAPHVATTGIAAVGGLAAASSSAAGRVTRMADRRLLPPISPALRAVRRNWRSPRLARVRRAAGNIRPAWVTGRFLADSPLGRFATGAAGVLVVSLIAAIPAVWAVAAAAGALKLGFTPVTERFALWRDRRDAAQPVPGRWRRGWRGARGAVTRAVSGGMSAARAAGRFFTRAYLAVEKGVTAVYGRVSAHSSALQRFGSWCARGRATLARIPAYVAGMQAAPPSVDDPEVFSSLDGRRVRNLTLREALALTERITGPRPRWGTPERAAWMQLAKDLKKTVRGTPDKPWLLEGEGSPEAIADILADLTVSALQRGERPRTFDVSMFGEATHAYVEAALRSAHREARELGAEVRAAEPPILVGDTPSWAQAQRLAAQLCGVPTDRADELHRVTALLTTAKQTRRGLTLGELARTELLRQLEGAALTGSGDSDLTAWHPDLVAPLQYSARLGQLRQDAHRAPAPAAPTPALTAGQAREYARLDPFAGSAPEPPVWRQPASAHAHTYAEAARARAALTGPVPPGSGPAPAASPAPEGPTVGAKPRLSFAFAGHAPAARLCATPPAAAARERSGSLTAGS